MHHSPNINGLGARKYLSIVVAVANVQKGEGTIEGQSV